MEIKFNLNENIKVKLTDAGYQHLADSYNELVSISPDNFEIRTADDYKKQADKDGYTTMQLWMFMKDFGPLIRLGFSPPFNLNFILVIK